MTQPAVPPSLGTRLSAWISSLAGKPASQAGLVVFCLAWFALGLSAALLTAGLSIAAITLAQMVLSRDEVGAVKAEHRDRAMHAKLDELVKAVHGARNELAGIEERDDSEIDRLLDNGEGDADAVPRPLL